MNKNLAILTVLAFVFCGWTWGGEKKKEEAPASKPVQKSAAAMPAQAKPVYAGYAGNSEQVMDSSSSGKTAAAPLKSLTTGTEEERRKRIESLVRFSEAMKKKREAQAA